MRLFPGAPEVEEVEEQTGDAAKKKEEEIEVDAKRLKRRAKKRKANAKKLAKKHEQIAAENLAKGIVVPEKKEGASGSKKPSKKPAKAAKAAKKEANSDSSWSESSDEEEADAKPASQPARPPPKSYFDPFTKKRIVIESSPAQSEPAPQTANKSAPASAESSKKRKAAVAAGSDSSSSSSSDESEEDEKKVTKPVQKDTPRTIYDPFTKKRIAVQSSTPKQEAAKSVGAPSGEAGKSKTPNTKQTKAKAEKVDSSSSSSSSDDSDDEEEPAARPTPSSAPRSIYDPFSKKRIVVQPQQGAAEDAKEAAKTPSKADAAAKQQETPKKSENPTPKKAKKPPSSDEDDDDSSSDESSEEEEAPTRKAAPLGPKTIYDPFAKKRVVVGGSADANAEEASGKGKKKSEEGEQEEGGQKRKRGAKEGAEEEKHGGEDGKRHKTGGEGAEGKAKPPPQSHTVFVGQLPFTATKADVARHFASCSSNGMVQVRLLTAKDTGKSRGIAFVQLPSELNLQAALLLDHSSIGGRRIRVERTAMGGGNDANRKSALKEMKTEQEQEMRGAVEAAIDAAFAKQREGEPGDLLNRTDIDAGVTDFLVTLPIKTVKKALEECVDLELKKIRNRPAYLMGFLKKQLQPSACA